jgi:hypothetical protein
VNAITHYDSTGQPTDEWLELCREIEREYELAQHEAAAAAVETVTQTLDTALREVRVTQLLKQLNQSWQFHDLYRFNETLDQLKDAADAYQEAL